MTNEPSTKITFTCDFCGKLDSEVRRMFAGSRRDGRQHTLCNECLFGYIAIMLHEDREWFEREVEEIKVRLGSGWVRTQFPRPTIYWLNLPDAGRLAIMPRPRASDWLPGEIAAWKAEGINVVVSLLEPQEVDELELRQEPTFCRAGNIEFVSFPIPDRDVPASMTETEQLVRNISAALADGKAVAIHCRAGIGRSSMIAACVLVCNGYDVNSAFDKIASARGVGVPDTEAQRAWVSKFQRGDQF